MPRERCYRNLVWGALLFVHGAALAAPGGLPLNTRDEDVSPEWLKIREYLFQQRPIHDHQSLVQLDLPRRAAFGASVPVAIKSRVAQTTDAYVKKIYLVIDKNPSPLAAVYDFTPESGLNAHPCSGIQPRTRDRRVERRPIAHGLALRESFEWLHATAESRSIKHEAELGNMKFRVAEKITAGEPSPVHLHISHPDNTGMELDQITVMYIPPHYVRKINVTFGGAPILSVEQDFSISEDPFVRFNFLPKNSGELKAEVEDSTEMKFTHAMPVKVGAGL